MTTTEAKQRGFTQAVKLHRRERKWYFRRPAERSLAADYERDNLEEIDGLMDSMGAIVYKDSAGYFDLPQKAIWMANTNGKL